MRPLTIAMLVGCALWTVSEVMEIALGGFSDTGNVVNALGLLCFAGGLWGVPLTAANRSRLFETAGKVVLSLGFVLFSARLITLVGTGVRSGAEISDTTLFKAAALATLAGTVLTAGATIRGGLRPPAYGWILIVCALISLATPLAGLPIAVQSLANIVVCVVFAAMAVQRSATVSAVGS